MSALQPIPAEQIEHFPPVVQQQIRDVERALRLSYELIVTTGKNEYPEAPIKIAQAFDIADDIAPKIAQAHRELRTGVRRHQP